MVFSDIYLELLWCQKICYVHHDVKICQDIKKIWKVMSYVKRYDITLWCQKVCSDVHHDFDMCVITSKSMLLCGKVHQYVCFYVKSMLWCQMYWKYIKKYGIYVPTSITTSMESTAWHHGVKNTSQHQKVWHDFKKYIMTSKDILVSKGTLWIQKLWKATCGVKNKSWCMEKSMEMMSRIIHDVKKYG